MSLVQYSNPIIPGFNPDPSITYVPGKGYFLVTSTFEFFPGLPVYHSDNLVEWRLIGHALNRRSQGVDMRTVEASAGLWAPTIRYNKGKWYVTCTCFYALGMSEGIPRLVEPTGFYVSTPDIFDDKQWSNAVYYDEQGFDQDLLFDDDDRVYLTSTKFHFSFEKDFSVKIVSYSTEIDLETGRSLRPAVLTMDSALGTAEGCHIIKKDGFYYLFTAEGGTQSNHQEWVYRSEKPLGPWQAPPEGVNPILFNDQHPDIQNTGHLDLIEGEGGRWWAVFLGVRPRAGVAKDGEEPTGPVPGLMPSHLGRETFMAPVEWVNGWPRVNDKKPIELVGQAVGLPAFKPKDTTWSDDFDAKVLQLGWYSVQTPLRPCYSFTERDGYLAIRGSGYPLDERESPAALFRKQPGFDGDFTTQLEFEPTILGEEAGVVIFLQRDCFVSLGLRCVGEKGELEMTLRTVIKDKKTEEAFPITAPASPLILCIHARTASYDLSFKPVESAQQTVVGTIPSTMFNPLFTGVHLGLYSQGAKGKPCMTSAFFKFAKWAPM